MSGSKRNRKIKNSLTCWIRWNSIRSVLKSVGFRFLFRADFSWLAFTFWQPGELGNLVHWLGVHGARRWSLYRPCEEQWPWTDSFRSRATWEKPDRILMENGGAYPAGNLRKNPICQPVILMHFHGFSWASMENGGTLLIYPSARLVLVHHFMTWVPNIEGIDTISISPFQDAEIKLTPMLHR